MTSVQAGGNQWVRVERVCRQKSIRSLRHEYRRATGFGVRVSDPDGRGGGRGTGVARCHARAHAIREAERWGEPCVMLDEDGLALWAVPLMENARVCGGLVVERVVLDGPDAACQAKQVRAGCELLLELAVSHNLTNGAHLELRRREARRERERAEALHGLKGNFYDGIREVYLREEPALLAAIKRGERAAAREIINRVLVGIYHCGGKRPELLKSLILELVVMMNRAAVEAGADPTEVLGDNYGSAARLARLGDDEELSGWLCTMLERAMDAIRDNDRYPNSVLLARALGFMADHIGENPDRGTVARAAGLSASHFSHLVREKTGHTFTELMTRYRVDRARELLLRTDKSLAHIALECGFCDQSHLARMLRRATGMTPREYRASRGGIARSS